MTRKPISLMIEGLSAGYARRPVIRDMTLGPIQAGHVTALVGPNAAGKSTLLLALAGLIGATGTVLLGERDLLRLSIGERATVAAFMPQTLPQGVALTVLELVIAAGRASPLGDLAIAGEELRRRAVATLDRLGVADLALEFLDRLSGGQRQLVGLAQALVREPQLLLLDEPTSALDLRHQVGVMTLVRALASEGRTVMVVLHDLNLAMRWADRIVVIEQEQCMPWAPPPRRSPQMSSPPSTGLLASRAVFPRPASHHCRWRLHARTQRARKGEWRKRRIGCRIPKRPRPSAPSLPWDADPAGIANRYDYPSHASDHAGRRGNRRHRPGAEHQAIDPASQLSRAGVANGGTERPRHLAGVLQAAAVRTYSVRRLDTAAGELDVDFVLHGDESPASWWAARAQPGNVLGIEAPEGERSAMPTGTCWRAITPRCPQSARSSKSFLPQPAAKP